MPTLAHIWRHPIKSHGREALEQVRLEANKTLPWDRTWAVAHEGARLERDDIWARCANFSRGAKAPKLMAINARLDETTEQISLSHPERPDLTLHPERDAAKLIEWVTPLMPADRAQSAKVVRATDRGMTDSPFPSIAIANLASHKAVETQLGRELSPMRWRANLWLDGYDAWDEFSWLGKRLRIGEAEFEVRERITRCLATTANPETGERDADTLGALKHWDHQDFGIYAVVTKSGSARLGDAVEVL